MATRLLREIDTRVDAAELGDSGSNLARVLVGRMWPEDRFTGLLLIRGLEQDQTKRPSD